MSIRTVLAPGAPWPAADAKVNPHPVRRFEKPKPRPKPEKPRVTKPRGRKVGSKDSYQRIRKGMLPPGHNEFLEFLNQEGKQNATTPSNGRALGARKKQLVHKA